ncbi:hypothetical protein ACF0H5_009819 [Mactra antiquata]
MAVCSTEQRFWGSIRTSNSQLVWMECGMLDDDNVVILCGKVIDCYNDNPLVCWDKAQLWILLL